MNKKGSKVIAWLLTLVMIFNMSPMTVFAMSSEDLDGLDITNPKDITVNYVIPNGFEGQHISWVQWGYQNNGLTRTGNDPTPSANEVMVDNGNTLAG